MKAQYVEERKTRRAWMVFSRLTAFWLKSERYSVMVKV